LPAPPPDTEASTLLIGSWVVPRDQHRNMGQDGDYTFKSDGTFSSYGVFHVGDQDLRIEVEGTWSVKDGVLIEELTKSSEPQRARIGSVSRDTLLAVTDREYSFRNEGAVEHTYVRK